MADKVTPERIAIIAAAARVPLPEGSPARIAKAVSPVAARMATRRLSPLEIEPASYVAVARKGPTEQPRKEAASDPALLSLSEVAAQIRARKLSSVEATQALFRASDNGSRNSTPSCASKPTRPCRRRERPIAAFEIRSSKGPLHGVPMAHKDMYYIAGKPAGCGSKVRQGWIAPATSTAIKHLQKAGAIRIGTLHMAEFAYGPTGHNAYLGPARNPWDNPAITGGSSSGSGAAVAARLTYAALGSDTGGSIRMPAHFCGVTGLKITNGRVSRANAMPLSFTLDTVGPLARSAEDCALIAEAIFGADPLDPVTEGSPAWDKAATQQPAGSLKIGVPKSFYVDDLEPDVAATIDAAIKVSRSSAPILSRSSFRTRARSRRPP